MKLIFAEKYIDPDEDDLKGDDDAIIAYLQLSRHPGKGSPGAVKETVWLHALIPDYKGPAIYLDFDSDKVLIGIEIIEDDE